MGEFNRYIRQILFGLRDPKAHHQRLIERIRMMDEGYLSSLRVKYGDLHWKPKSIGEIESFYSMEEMVAFMAECAEDGDYERLATAMTELDALIKYDRNYPYFFSNTIFKTLGQIQKREDFRDLHGNQGFGDELRRSSRGGRFILLEEVRVEVKKVQRGWVIVDIWLEQGSSFIL